MTVRSCLRVTRRLPAASLTLLLCTIPGARIAAQTMLQNGDVESWTAAPSPMTGLVPVDWNLLWPNTINMTSPSTTAANVHCGATSCQVDVVGNWSEVGKQHGFAAPPTGALHARLRVFYPPASQQPSNTITGTLTLLVAGYVIGGGWTPVAGSSSVVVQPSQYWQEFKLSYVPIANPTADLIRVNAVFSNGGGQRYFLDSVDFAGSSPVYGTLQVTNAKQVRSTALSLIFDDYHDRLRELRRVNDAGCATGPNYLDTTGSPPGSTLYNGVTRTTISGGATWFDSWQHSLAVTEITPVSPLFRTGWRIVGTGSTVSVDLAIYSEPQRAEVFFEPVATPANVMLEALNCPNLAFRPYPGGGTSSRLVYPTGGGALVNLDATAFAHVSTLFTGEDWIGGEYPGSAALQLQALYDDSDGVAMMAQDTSGANKSITARLVGSPPRVDLSIQHRLPSVLSTTPVATFRRALVPCVEDWRHAADQYRDWVRGTNLWTNAVVRPTASWVDDRPTVYEADLMPQGIGEDLVPLGDWDVLMTDWTSALAAGSGSGRMLPLFRSFEQNGTFIGPNYLPLQVLDTGPVGGPYPQRYNQTAILTSWVDTHNTGARPMAMIAGLNWAWSRPGTLPADATGCTGGENSYWQYSFSTTTAPTPGSVVKDRNGADWFQPLPSNPASWQYSYYVMDPRHSLTLSTHTVLARTLAAGGLDLYLFDQMNGGGVLDNFSTAFGSPGAGPWKVSAIRNLFAATLVAGRGSNALFELSIEDPCEQSIDLIAVQGFRPDNMLQHPARDYGQSEAVPLFPYVFHEVVSFVTWDLNMFSDWLAGQSWATTQVARMRQLNVVELARTLTAGCWMGTSIQPWTLVSEYINSLSGTGVSPCSSGAGQAMVPWASRADSVVMPFLKRCVAMSQGPAKQFLNKGKMVRTVGLASGGTVTVHIDPFASTPTFVHPAICHSAWEYQQGHALLLANVDLVSTVGVTLPISVGTHRLMPGDQLTVYLNGGAATPLTYTPGMSYMVPPASVVFITM